MSSNLIRQRVRHVDYEHKTALVVNRNGKAYSVNLSDKVIYDGIQAKDLAFIRIINDYWIIVDFERDYPVRQDNFDMADLMGAY